MSDDSRPSDRSDRSIQLFVGRLPIDTDIKEVEDRFSKYGQMSRCDLKRGIETNLRFYCTCIINLLLYIYRQQNG